MGEPVLTAVIPINRLDNSNLGVYEVVSKALNAGINVSIVINNEDGTIRKSMSEIFEKIQSDKLKLFYSNIQSPGTSRNIGIKNCSTRYLTFWDSDDVPNIPEVLKLVDRLKNNPDKKYGIGSYQTQDSVTGKIVSRNKIIGKKKYESTLIKNPGIWRWIFLTAEVKEVEFQEFRMGEDQDFIAELNPDLREALFTNDITYTYTSGNQGQLTKSKKAIDEISKSIRFLCLLNRSSNRNYWSRRLLTRQVLTGMKHATFKVKLKIILTLFKVTIYND